ncbi:MAG: TonB-dependent receptor [Wenzhouxiangellaceae bacterium]
MNKSANTSRRGKQRKHLTGEHPLATANRRRYRRTPLYVALLAGMSMVMPALAQEADRQAEEEATRDEVQAADESEALPGEDDDSYELTDLSVTGFARSVERSITTKRDSSSIVEAVYAEEIGKLPDVSIAEALARLPGLTSQRTDGRSQTISIRGLGPDFSTALLNGREQVTTGDNRGVEFDQYPAELLGSVVVYKTPDSTLIGSGLAGTVDMRTIRPLDTEDRVVALNARYEFTGDSSLNPDGQDDGYRASFAYVDQFADRTVGITLGAAIQSTPNQIERFNAWGYPDIGDGQTLVPGGAKPFVQSNDLDRLGLIGTFEYAPSTNFRTIVDLSYSDFEETQILRGIEFPLFWSAAQLRDGFTVNDGLITEGVFDNVKGVMRNDLNEREAELFTFGWNTRFEFNDLWGAEADISYSRAEREDVLLESYTGTGPGALGLGATDSLGFRIDDNGVFQFSPSLDYTDTNLFLLTDPQGWGAGAQPNPLTQAGFINNPSTTDWLTHLRFSVDRAFTSGPFSKAVLGVDLSRRDKERTINQTFLTLPNDATSLPIPDAALIDGDVDLSFIGIPGQVVYDPTYLLQNVYTLVPAELSSFNVPQDWRVREDVFTGFIRFDIDTLVGGTMPLRGNIGLQVVHTDQTSTGFRVTGADTGSGIAAGTFIPVQDGDDYLKLLPSLNLILEMANDQQLRFGASRVLARPRMDQLNASVSLNTNFTRLTSPDPNQSFFSANGGNPLLRPTIANTVDLSYAKYFADESGYVSLSGYYKDLQDYINPDDAFLFDFSAFIPSFLNPELAALLGTPLGTVSGPTNRGDGNLWGFELSSAIPFGHFFEPLDGFGLLFSASYTDSSVTLGDSDTETTIPGLSEWVTNTTLFFEKNGFQARVSHRYRSEFLSEIFGISATRVTRTAAAENIIDAQIGYEIQTGSLKGLNIVLQANNLTDEPFTTFDGDDNRRVIDRQVFGRNFLIGASYRF